MQASDSMTLLALLKLPDAAWQYIQDLRARYYPSGYSFLAPHFTLFNLPASHAQSELTTVLNQQKLIKIPFCLRSALFMPPLHGHQGWYAFLMPELGFSELTKLQRQLSIALDIEQQLPFLPHLTVGKFSDPKSCWQLVDTLNTTGLALEGCIKQISLVQGPQTLATIRLR